MLLPPMQEGILRPSILSAPFSSWASVTKNVFLTLLCKTYKATNQKVQGKKRFSAGCKYHISVISTFVSSITHSQGLGKNYWDVTQHVGWSSRSLLLKRFGSRGEGSPCPAEAGSPKDRFAKGRAKHKALTRNAVCTQGGDDPGSECLFVVKFHI